jgi:hypothetical protein
MSSMSRGRRFTNPESVNAFGENRVLFSCHDTVKEAQDSWIKKGRAYLRPMYVGGRLICFADDKVMAVQWTASVLTMLLWCDVFVVYQSGYAQSSTRSRQARGMVSTTLKFRTIEQKQKQIDKYQHTRHDLYNGPKGGGLSTSMTRTTHEIL